MATPKSAAPVKKAQPKRKRSSEALRSVRIWVPDLTPRRFRAEAHRQSLAVAASPGEREDQEFVDKISSQRP